MPFQQQISTTPSMSDRKPHSTTSVLSVLAPDFLINQHEARLDAFITKLTTALHTPNISPKTIAERTLELVNETTDSTVTGSSKRTLLSSSFQRALLIQLKHSLPDSEQHEQQQSDLHQQSPRLRSFDSALSLINASMHLVSLLQDRNLIDRRLPTQLFEFLFSLHSQRELESKVSEIRKGYEDLAIAARNGLLSEFNAIKLIETCIARDRAGCHPVLSGYLRLMLVTSLPPWHLSCMKRTMMYNQDMEQVDVDVLLKEHQNTTVDVALYRAFWTAQNGMRNPSKAESVEEWRKIAPCMERVISAFKTVPPNPAIFDDDNEIKNNVDDEDMKLTSSAANIAYNNTVVGKNGTTKTDMKRSNIPKNLTSPSILRLQIEDICVRRQVLAQYTIFLHHLETISGYTPTSKDTASIISGIEHCKSLFSPGAEGTRLKKQVYDLMNNDTDGKFKRFVSSILHRERRWIHWKKQTGYNHLNGKKATPATVFKRRKVRSKVGDRVMKSSRLGGGASGWKERQRAWMVPPPAERAQPLLERAQAEIWSRDVLKMELQEDMEDEDVTDDMKRKNDSKYVWRTLRMLCEEDIACLTKVSRSRKGTLDLEALVKDENERAPESANMKIESKVTVDGK